MINVPSDKDATMMDLLIGDAPDDDLLGIFEGFEDHNAEDLYEEHS